MLPFTIEGTPKEIKSRDLEPMNLPSAIEMSRIAAWEETIGGGGANYTLPSVEFVPLLGEVLLGGPCAKAIVNSSKRVANRKFWWIIL